MAISPRTRRKHAPAPASSIEAYGRRLRAGKAPGDGPLAARLPIADVETETASDSGAKTYTFTISTATIDRDRDVIAVDGWRTDAFMRAGGPVLYGHGYDANGTMPIGKCTRLWATSKALKASMVFIAGDPFAERVQRAVDFGALRATSVGFRPLPGRAAWNEERQGIDFLEQELLEFSIIPIPANPDATREKNVLVTGDPAVYLTHAEALRAAVDLAAALGKRGRVLSTANEDRIRSAYGHGEELCAALSEVLAQVEAMDEEPEPEPAKSAPAPADPVVLRVLPEPSVRSGVITASDIRGATVAALTELVAAAVRHHTGRLD